MPDTDPDCQLCGDTGWITTVDLDGESAWEIPCPEGCPMPQPAGARDAVLSALVEDQAGADE